MTPAPFCFSALFFVSTRVLDDTVRRVWLDDAFTLPAPSWSARCFQEIFNTHYADPDFYLPESSTAISARLPALIQTMDIVGAEELELTWEDYVMSQTGRRPRKDGSEPLDKRWGRMKRRRGDLLNLATSMDADVHEFGHLERWFGHSVTKNYSCDEAGFLCHVVGSYAHPLLADADHDALVNRYDVDLLLTRDGWIPRNDQENDSYGAIVGDSSQASINLFEGGDLYMVVDTTGDAGLGASGNLQAQPAEEVGTGVNDEVEDTSTQDNTDQPDDYNATVDLLMPSRVYTWFGASILTDLGLFQ